MAITTDVVLPVDVSLSARGAEARGTEGPLARSMAPLTPEDTSADALAVASVTYWVRVVLTGVPIPDPAGKRPPQVPMFWSTHPVLILPGQDAGAV